MNFFDTHCHLDDDQFGGDPSAVIGRAREAGVARLLAVATSLASSQRVVALARSCDAVRAAVGIHPNYCHEAAAADWDGIVALAHAPETAALGETGLDRHWDFAPFALQQDYFDRHLRLAQATGLPFIVHMRDCEDDVMTMLREARSRGELRGVMHSFAGVWATAAECLELGLHVSFSGIVTYKKSDELRAIAARLPADRLLIETDAPYLSPHPKRGQRPNEPALIVHTAQCLAETRAVPLAILAQQTFDSADQLFRPTQGLACPMLAER